MCGHGHHAERMKERLFLKRDNTVILVIDIQDKLSKAMFNEEQIKKNAKVKKAIIGENVIVHENSKIYDEQGELYSIGNNLEIRGDE